MIDYKNGWYETMKPNYKEFDEALPEWWAMKYEDRWTLITEVFNGKPLSLLDVGCGRGRALSYYSRFVPVIGVEPSVSAGNAVKALGFPLIEGYFDEVDISQTFDVIHMEQVLSHSPNFMDMLNKAYGLLNDGGVIVVEEPNDNNPLQKLLEPKYGKYWVTADHANYFDYSSMQQAMEEAGFEVEVKMGTYPMELFELSGDVYIGNEEAGKQVHAKRVALELNLPYVLRTKMQEAWAKMGIGRDIVLFGIKKGVC